MFLNTVSQQKSPLRRHMYAGGGGGGGGSGRSAALAIMSRSVFLGMWL